MTRRHVGELPLMKAIVERLKLHEILNDFIPKKSNEEVSPADALLLIIYNLAVEKMPLYELPQWVNSLDLRCINYEKYRDVNFTDDRFGKCLDRLYSVDRASLLTSIVIQAVQAFNIDLSQIHNDSTSVKGFGQYQNISPSGFELRFGKSKDHRPDLKQLIYSLSIAADGAVPVHCKIYPGNRNDDTTHIETWETLNKICGRSDFLYVGDCKLCTDNQLSHIAENGGRALTTIPNQWLEVCAFKENLLKNQISKKEVWRRTLPDEVTDYFSVFSGNYTTSKRGYTIHWVHSTAKKKGDQSFREEQLKKAEKKLSDLPRKINKRNLKAKEAIEKACSIILRHYKVEKFVKIMIDESEKEQTINKPGKIKADGAVKYTLTWERNTDALEAEKNLDGVFPLLSTDATLSPKEAIIAFKYQPRLEKRFTQLKSIHLVAPLLCKKLERIEANMFLFFIALMIQSLIEREVRLGMIEKKIKALEIYPENRDAVHPTTSKIFELFNKISTYTISENSNEMEMYTDTLTPIQHSILQLLSLNEEVYWQGIKEQCLA